LLSAAEGQQSSWGMDLSPEAKFPLFSRQFYLVSMRLRLENSFHVFVLFTRGFQYPAFIRSLSCPTSLFFFFFIVWLVPWCARLLDGNLWKWTDVMSSVVCLYFSQDQTVGKKGNPILLGKSSSAHSTHYPTQEDWSPSESIVVAQPEPKKSHFPK
jgi:hypothetical protein